MPLAKKDTETSLFVALSALTKSFWEVTLVSISTARVSVKLGL